MLPCKGLIGIEARGVAAPTARDRASVIGFFHRAALVGRTDNRLGDWTGAEDRNRALNDLDVERREGIVEAFAVPAPKIAEDGERPATLAHHDATARGQSCQRCRIDPWQWPRVARPCLTCLCWFGRAVLTLASAPRPNQHVRVHLEQPGGCEILLGLHVVDTANDEIARRAVDVEEVLACLNFANALDLVAVDRGDLGLGETFDQRCLDRRSVVCRRGMSGGCNCSEGASERKGGPCHLPCGPFEFHDGPQFLMKVPSRNTTSTAAPVGISTTG